MRPFSLCSLCFLLLIFFICGCGAPGPRSLLKGEDLLKERRYEPAIEQLLTAVTLLPKNAQAHNHLGLAYHGAGHIEQAQRAYRHALSLDMNLTAARYNLGCLALEQNDTVGALEHFTSYTAFQPNVADGWIKLGNAQLRARRLDDAEKSFKNALDLRPRDPEALNGLGNAAYHRRRPQEALAFFTAAIGEDPKYAPALLNSAVVHHSQNNRQHALQAFRQYAALTPASPSLDGVSALVDQLEAEAGPPAITGIARTNALPPPPARLAPTSAPPQIVTTPQRPPQIIVPPARTNVAAKPAGTTAVARTAPVINKPTDAPVQIAQVDDDLVVKAPQDVSSRTTTNTDDKKGLLARVNPFANRVKAATNPTAAPAVAPAPATNVTRVAPAPPPAPTYPRYRYLSPVLPKPGNRREASRLNSEGVTAYRAGVLAQAAAKYQQAVEADPSYFDAYYNLGLATYDLGRWKQSLSAYEVALALKPESIDTRYNFALALKQAGHPIDAADELKRILQANPNEVRAHLSLGNLYAQQLAQSALARHHYQRVLAAEPNHPKSGEIRYWLAANP
jgi:tetratricopeptide (TPR) repeat protein